MTDTVIRVEKLSKQYSISSTRNHSGTFVDALGKTLSAPIRALRARVKKSNEEKISDLFWAVKDISFEVMRGETVGIVGRNGAGKSTLLKLLSRITEPTSGYADIQGRVGSLLEVGTGFHHELTGRENVYLNGAIMGMNKAEIKRKFDEIVAFAEVERFIDMPVKHYSSGMYLRLAFSVAAYLEPEILLVDEVLAVGDLAFQRKCLGKMEDVAAHGRTVLFVSHNLAAVKNLCQTSIVLNNGAMEFRGPVVEGLAHYGRCLTEEPAQAIPWGTGWRDVVVNDHTGGFCTSIEGGEPFCSEATLDLENEFAGGKIFLIISDSAGEVVIHQRIDSRDLIPGPLKAGRYRLRSGLPALWLAPGVYTLYFKFIGRSASSREENHYSERVILDVTGRVDGIGRAMLAPPLSWQIIPATIRGETTDTSGTTGHVEQQHERQIA